MLIMQELSLDISYFTWQAAIQQQQVHLPAIQSRHCQGYVEGNLHDFQPYQSRSSTEPMVLWDRVMLKLTPHLN